MGADTKQATITKSGDKYTLELTEAPATDQTITVEYEVSAPAPAPNAVLCTNFGEFKIKFPDEVKDAAWSHLAHAVYGFFNNDGGRCYVICADTVTNALAELATIDEIALVAAPGKTDNITQDALIDHCEEQDGIFYRVAILDGAQTGSDAGTIKLAKNSKYAALYYPWIKVADPKNPKNTVDIPPSGHIAGIYARVDPIVA